MVQRSLRVPMLVTLITVLSLSTLLSLDVRYAQNQAVFLMVSAAVYIGVSSRSFRWWRTTSRWWYFFGCLLLLLTLILGKTTKGATSWLNFAGYSLQPSELMKPALALSWSQLVARTSLEHWRGRILAALTIIFPLGLILLQPDLGSALIIVGGMGVAFLAARPPLWLVTGGVFVAILTAGLGWQWLQPYQQERILAFVEPSRDPLGTGYNARQAMIAVGAGGLWGQGFGRGSQSHLRFLPERQTDFLFASYAEETGFVGSVSLILLYALLLLILWHTTHSHPSRVVQLYGTASVSMFFLQVVENVGMNIGLLPITGITLPLFSLGGSSLLATAIALGLLESARRTKDMV